MLYRDQSAQVRLVCIPFTAALCCVTSALLAQDAPKVQEPEYLGIFTVLDSNGSLEQLERQTPSAQVKVKMGGFRGATTAHIIPGAHSPVRFPASQKLEFVVKMDAGGHDPSLMVHLVPLVVAKDKREFVTARVGTMGHSARSTANDTLIAFNIAKYGEQSYRVVPTAPLPPGEYAIGGAGVLAFCFGVDAAK